MRALRSIIGRGLSRTAQVITRASPSETPAGSAASVAGTVAGYWTRHNVTQHYRFTSAEESLAYLRWRNDQYFGYEDLMPVTGHDGTSILDYGCGPGHDLVGFGVHSRPRRLVGCDVSRSSLNEAQLRLGLHGINCELTLLDPEAGALPFSDEAFDYVHSSGVLHHTPDPVAILREFRRILRPGGQVRVMVYNYDSIWLHLYVAYQKLVEEDQYPTLSVREAFGKTTDGEDCPIALVYKPGEFIGMAERAGFAGEFLGAAISVFEASLMPLRFRAIMNQRLPEEHRSFLTALQLDSQGLPKVRGHYAGVDGCYLLLPKDR